MGTAVNVTCTNVLEDWIDSETRLYGTVKSWKEAWGFVVSPGNFDGDLFVHMGQLELPPGCPPPSNGDAVSFSVGCDTKGRCNAMAVRSIQYVDMFSKMKRVLESTMGIGFAPGFAPKKRQRKVNAITN